MEEYYRHELKMMIYWAETNLMRQCNRWLEARYHPLKVYMRVRDRLDHDGTRIPVLDLASLSVKKEHQRKGHFTAFLELMETIAKENKRAVFVESILEPWLFQWLQEKRGYEVAPHDDRSLIKPFTEEPT